MTNTCTPYSILSTPGTIDGDVAILTQPPKAGTFVWETAVTQATLDLDPQKGIYFPTTDSNGLLTGYWCRQYTADDIHPEWWGASGAKDEDGNPIDETILLQAAINFADAIGGGTIRLSAMYNVGSLTVPDSVSLVGNNNSRCGFQRIGGNFEFVSFPGQKYDTCGPTLALKPQEGRSAAPYVQQALRDFEIDGGNIGVIQLQGKVTAGSNSVALSSAPDGALPPTPGFYIEGIGIPKDTQILSWDAANPLALTLTATATVSNHNPDNSRTDKTKLKIREACTAGLPAEMQTWLLARSLNPRSASCAA